MNLIPLQYRIVGALIIAMAIFVGGFATGAKIVADRAAAKQLDAEQKAEVKYKAEVDRGNALSAKLAASEDSINKLTLERAKNVQKVTSGRECLSANAVSLLNGSYPKLSESAGKPVAESTGTSAATDSDVEQWAIESQGLYDTCSARLNALIDWEANK